MLTTVSTTGSATENSVMSTWRRCETIIAPTTTRAAAATSVGTTDASGETNIAARTSAPVTRMATPARAPSPIPAPDSTNTWFDDADAAPPATAPTPSTTSADRSRGKVPSGPASPASRDNPVKVPMASKKFANTSVNTKTVAASTPIRLNPAKLNSPINDRSGSANGDPSSAGTDRPQPPGRSAAGPRCQTASITAATTVPPINPIRIAPRTRRAMRMPVTSSVATNSTVGTVVMEPPPSTPSPVGGDGRPVEPMNPALTRPMNRMNNPIPAVIDSFSCIGTAS